MTLSRRARQLLVLAVLLGGSALLLRSSARAPEKMNFVDRALYRLSGPLQAGAARLFGSISGAWRHYVALTEVSRESERLQTENARLRSQLESAQQLVARTERLERLLELRGQVLADTAAAQVIGVETSKQFRVVRVRLDRGSAEVAPGMPVLAAGGVVGRVTRAVGAYSDVQLATDPKSSIDVVLPRTGSRGVLKGTASDSRYLCRVEYLVREDAVQTGDLVMTSGLGGIFPRDVPVGRVVALRKSDASLYQEIEVEPVVDFGKLREVLIVLAPPPPPDPDAGKRPVEGVRGVGVPR